MHDHLDQADYWARRYREGSTGWDLGQASPPLRAYADQLTDKDQRILVPGAGNGYEVAYFFHQGFSRVFILDIARPPLDAFRKRVPDLPAEQVLHADFFRHEGQYDLIVEQTFFCAFAPSPERRQAYADQVARLLRPGGKLVGLWWSFPLREGQANPPFGGSRQEYLGYFEKQFTVHTFAPCRNSAPGREGKEFFGIFIRNEEP